ncbi:restriction system protein [Methanomicrobium sp. W14]|uniref:restriction endonuclease n=1 Tax=Methanomicrobium sp. W14 TaxID=2817839 RepID=UPI001AE38922|nr:restriction endonuclease [Methanomicrobium sp. W14]MBP2133644.1 restriction system protein [Methanomicrobium sp. W14]
MPVPSYEEFMLPFLRLLEDKDVHTVKDIREKLAEYFRLSDSDKAELLPSGRVLVYRSRIGWAKTYLKKALLIDNSVRGKVQITKRGLIVLKKNPEKIDSQFLLQFHEFREFTKADETRKIVSENETTLNPETPEDRITQGYQEFRNSLASDLLEQIMQMSPEFFEKLVVDLLVAMGYGGSRSDAGRVVGKSGDDGVDGIIKEDKLGLEEIYIQAKHWNEGNVVGSADVRNFIGSLTLRGAKKGVFITTSRFSKRAVELSEHPNTKIVLIDGSKLVDLMIEYNLGVSTYEKYIIKKIDTDYFSED